MSSIIINNIHDIENYSYLELGIYNNVNFNSIKCTNKFSVDMNGKAMFTGTTDEYFQQLSKDEKFDIIFIDANHDYEYVVRDFNNAIDHATNWILIHDMIPKSAKFTQSKYCSDSFRVLQYLITETNFEIYTMDNNFGLTFVKMPAGKINPPEHYSKISYDEFVEFISKVKLYSDEEIINLLRKQNV
jgi:hypothetical protein